MIPIGGTRWDLIILTFFGLWCEQHPRDGEAESGG